MLVRAMVTRALAGIKRDFIAHVDSLAKGVDTVSKSAKSKKLDAIVLKYFDEDFENELTDRLTVVATDGADLAMVQINETGEAALTLANENAIAWAEEHAAELVKIDGPESIARSTRDLMQDLVARAEENGWSNADLSGEIQDHFGFSRSRGDVIARTETARADVQGNLVAYSASALVDRLKWVTANDDRVSDECLANDGEIVEMGEAFTSGATAPPGHPNCRCDVLPVFKNDDDEANSGSEAEGA